jgi:predicted ArsR family transcriptional regulator
MKKEFAETSMDAYKQVHPEMKKQHHQKIIEALRSLGIASMEQIAGKAGMELMQVSRRMNEIEADGFILKAEGKGKTSSGRSCFLYQLVPPTPTEKVKELNKFWKDYQSGKLETPETRSFIQQNLFQ